MSEQQLEQKIQDLGLNAPRVTPEIVDSKIVGESYTTLPSGKTLVCELILQNGFSVRGHSSVVSPENFNEQIGIEVSRRDAREKIWELEAYLLQERLYQESKQSS